MTVPTIRVREIAEQIRGVTFAKADAISERQSDYVPVIRAGNIQDGNLVFADLLFVPRHRVASKQRLRPDDVVITASSGSLATIGKAARVAGSQFEGTFGAFLKVLRPSDGVHPAYFAHYFQTMQYRRTVAALAAGANINNLKNEHLDELEIRLPSFEEQRWIAAILDQADALRAKRRQVLAHLDALTQSIFHDMFGRQTWPVVTAGEIMPSMRNGLSPATGGQYEATVLTLSAITQGTFDPSSVKQGVFAMDPPMDKRVTTLDFMMCRGNGNKNLVGAGVFSRQDRADLVFPDTVIAGRVDPDKVELPFLGMAWKQPDARGQIDIVARTTNGTYKVNQSTLSKVTIPLPPIELQREFTLRMDVVRAHREVVLQACVGDDDLFTSLQSRAFKGEL